VDAWLDRIEPRVITEWMAFERLEPFGWPLIRVVVDWLRSIFSLLVSASSQAQFDRNKMPDITVAGDAVPSEAESEDSEEADEPVEADPDAADDAEFRDAAAEPTSEDILRAVREQNQFRF
jgi:hypothetical protein